MGGRNMASQWSWSGRTIFFWQVVLLVTFYVFVFGIIIWIVRLLWLSWQLNDVFSASIGITLVGIPLFLFLLAVYNYVFWGILINRKRKGKE
jgi:hypothetical protein